MTDFENSRIEKLKRALYSRDEASIPKEERSEVSGNGMDVPTSWGETPSFDYSPNEMTKKNNSFFNKFLLFSVIFFVVSLAIAAFIFFGGFNMISSSNVDIKVSGSNSVASGEETDLNITILNQNRTSLENAVLYVEYPEGVRQVDQAKNSRVKVSVGTLAKGASFDYPIRVLVMGEKDSVKTVRLSMEYNVSGSNATFSKEKNYDISINSSPIIMDVSYPKEINSGQEVTLNISMTSNSSVPITDALVKVEYPYGFTYTDSSIKPVRDNSVWSIGDLKNGDRKTLIVKGTLIGQNMEDRSFRVSVGSQSSEASKDFETELAVSQITLGIRKSFFDLSLTNSSDPNDKGLPLDQTSQLNVGWRNTLPEKIVDSKIYVRISGNVLDKSKVSANHGGLYQSLDGSITWDKNTTNSLANISPGNDGAVSFSLGTLFSASVIRSVKNPHIDVSVKMEGERTGLDSATISSEVSKTIKFRSNLTLISKSFRNIGGITNTGPIPPRVDQESTYTITWTISNTTNDLKDVVVSSVLPAGVEWKSKISPQSERISYDPGSRNITWNLGAVSSGIGYDYAPREVSFQVSIIPNAAQVSQVLNLLGNVNASALDTYTEGTLRVSAPGVTTQVSDPGFNAGSVVK